MVRPPSTPFRVQRHPRYSAILCLSAFFTGCVEQGVVLTSDKFEPGYDVVHYGPKVRVTDGMGREISTEGMFDGGASLTDLADPASLTPQEQADVKNATKFLFVPRHVNAGGGDTLTISFHGIAMSVVVVQRGITGAPRAFKVLGNGRELSFAANPDIGVGSMTVYDQGALAMVVQVSPAGPGEGSFTGAAGAASLTDFAMGQSPRALFRSMASAQEETGLQEGDSDINDDGCNAIAMAGLNGLFAFLAMHTLISGLAWATAMVGGGLALIGVLGALTILLFYKWWDHEIVDWAAGSPSCLSKYGEMGPYVGDHLVNGFTRLWNQHFGV